MRYRGTGVPVSQAAHGRRPVSTAVTIALAALAALITLWLGSLAHFSAGAVAPAHCPDQLAVVQVQAGESLQQVAARVAPDAPVSQVVERIRDLNKLIRRRWTPARRSSPRSAEPPIRPWAGDEADRWTARVGSGWFISSGCSGEGAVMHCPFCRHPDSRVVDSRETDEGQAIRRRRSCPECGRRFTTVETAVLAVVKRSGVTEPFSREKVISGVRRACQGRQVDDDALNLLAQQVEDTVRAAGSPEVASHEVGLAILGPLRELDEVAYLRFASVYRSFSSAEDFEREIEALRAHRAVGTSG